VAAMEDAAAAGAGVRERGGGEERGCFNVSWHCRVKQNLSFVISPSLLVATGPASWTDQDAMAFCKQFLPVGATKTDAATNHQTFHADVGDLRLDVAAAACDLTIIT
jgi:hypothetical protein